jgi:hypothetical protein
VSSIGTVGHLPRRSPAAKKSRGEAKAPGRWKRRCTGGGGGEGRPGEDGGAGEDGGKMPTTTAWPVAGCPLDWAGKVSVVEILHGLTYLSAVRFVNLNPLGLCPCVATGNLYIYSHCTQQDKNLICDEKCSISTHVTIVHN